MDEPPVVGPLHEVGRPRRDRLEAGADLGGQERPAAGGRGLAVDHHVAEERLVVPADPDEVGWRRPRRRPAGGGAPSPRRAGAGGPGGRTPRGSVRPSSAARSRPGSRRPRWPRRPGRRRRRRAVRGPRGRSRPGSRAATRSPTGWPRPSRRPGRAAAAGARGRGTCPAVLSCRNVVFSPCDTNLSRPSGRSYRASAASATLPEPGDLREPRRHRPADRARNRRTASRAPSRISGPCVKAATS